MSFGQLDRITRKCSLQDVKPAFPKQHKEQTVESGLLSGAGPAVGWRVDIALTLVHNLWTLLQPHHHGPHIAGPSFLPSLHKAGRDITKAHTEQKYGR